MTALLLFLQLQRLSVLYLVLPPHPLLYLLLLSTLPLPQPLLLPLLSQASAVVGHGHRRHLRQHLLPPVGTWQAMAGSRRRAAVQSSSSQALLWLIRLAPHCCLRSRQHANEHG
jgi:hypothetical protein